MQRAEPDPIVPSDDDVQLAREATRVLEGHHGSDMTVRLQVTVGGVKVDSVDLPICVVALLASIVYEIGEGKSVKISATGLDVTMLQAADLLNVSQAALVGMIDMGKLPARTVDDQCIPLKDVISLKRDTQAKWRAALDELPKSDQKLGLRSLSWHN